MGTLKGINTEADLRKLLGGPIPGIDEARASCALDGETVVMPTFVQPGISVAAGLIVIYVDYQSKSESNLRDWKARSRRSGEAWKAVRAAIGRHLALLDGACRHYESEGALRVTFTRLGGRAMDRSNLPAAFKGVEDSIAYLIGANDGDPRWHPLFEQQPGGNVGVRIVVELI